MHQGRFKITPKLEVDTHLVKCRTLTTASACYCVLTDGVSLCYCSSVFFCCTWCLLFCRHTKHGVLSVYLCTMFPTLHPIYNTKAEGKGTARSKLIQTRCSVSMEANSPEKPILTFVLPSMGKAPPPPTPPPCSSKPPRPQHMEAGSPVCMQVLHSEAWQQDLCRVWHHWAEGEVE